METILSRMVVKLVAFRVLIVLHIGQSLHAGLTLPQDSVAVMGLG
jgi:hypothetical protein